MDKILVVDDDLDILTLVKMSLKMHGFDVEALSKWEQINNNIDSFSPDLILLDVSLGGADGREICKRLKNTTHTAHIPVILFSANADMEKSLAYCHAEGFIAKPYELSHFLTTIRKTLAESRERPH